MVAHFLRGLSLAAVGELNGEGKGTERLYRSPPERRGRPARAFSCSRSSLSTRQVGRGEEGGGEKKKEFTGSRVSVQVP